MIKCKLCDFEEDRYVGHIQEFPETGQQNFYLCNDCQLKLRRLAVSKAALKALKQKELGKPWNRV